MTSDIKVGVVLAREADDLGRWLAEAASFDAAGAHALWIDVVANQELDPLVLTAALAAVTSRSLLVADLGPHQADTVALATLARLSRGRLRIVGDGDPGPEVFCRLPGSAPDDPPAFEHLAADQTERWVMAQRMQGREAWQATLAEAAEGGVAGLLVPAGPGLLDLLRNPGEPGQRRDLELTVG